MLMGLYLYIEITYLLLKEQIMDNTAFFKLTYGLFLLTAKEHEKDNGCIINTAIQVANNPTRISIAVQKGNLTHDMIKNTGIFNISSLSTQASFSLFQRFGMQSGRDTDKFANFMDIARSDNGIIYLTTGCNMYMSATVTDCIDLGSHSLFIAEVTDAVVLSEDESCTYSYYQSHIKPQPAVQTQKHTWVCSVCGYVYEGNEIPDDFECPLCHHPKEDFILNT